MNGAALVEARGLTLQLGPRTLLRGLDWRAAVGERWCVIGRNAAGKSTLLRVLADLPTAARVDGDLAWLGRAPARWPAADAARVRAFMPQHASDRFAVGVRRLLQLSTVRPGRDADTELAALGAAALAERHVLQLSGGERQRVALAQCALQGAPLWLLDEPVAFQDPAQQLLVARWLAAQADAALVLSAHDVNWIARVATHVLALHGDGGWSAGPVDEMLEAVRLEQVYGCPWRETGGWWIAG